MTGLAQNVLAVLLSTLVNADTNQTGTITAVVKTAQPLTGSAAVQRQAEQITTTKGKEHDIGMYARVYEGRITEGKLVIEGLPVPGVYDLQFETKNGGMVCGWDPNVPESDYVGDPPLEDEAKTKILKKMADEEFSAFSDQMWILDMQGNVQHAVLLVMALRMRPFVGGNYQPGEWVWRIERWQWENPEEDTWVPYRRRPFYALNRQRLYEKQLKEKQILFARHLGGICLTKERQTVDLGAIQLPQPVPGVFAVHPDGSFIPPVILKGPEKPDWPVMPKEIMPEKEQAGGAK